MVRGDAQAHGDAADSTSVVGLVSAQFSAQFGVVQTLPPVAASALTSSDGALNTVVNRVPEIL